MQGYSTARHCKIYILRLTTAGILRGHSTVRRCRDAERFGRIDNPVGPACFGAGAWSVLRISAVVVDPRSGRSAL